MIEARTQLAAKIETTEGTAIALAAADAVLAANMKFEHTIDQGERPNKSASISPWPNIPGARQATLEFDVELKGSGTAGTAPEFGKLLKACGFAETVVASTSVTYLPSSSGFVSLTMGLYEDGMCHLLWGARGTVKLSLEAGKPAMMHFVFKGADFSVTDVAMLTAVSYQSSLPPAFLSASFTIDSYAALIGKLEFDLANKVSLRPDANQGSGFKSAVITARRPVMSFDPEKVLVAGYDFYGKLRSGNLGALTATVGSVAGNRCVVTAPKVQYTKIAEADKDGLRTLGIDCLLARNTGDDELSLAFT